MGCGIGDFARRGLKMPKTQDFWVFILSPGDLDSWRHMGPRLAAQAHCVFLAKKNEQDEEDSRYHFGSNFPVSQNQIRQL